ncbi:MAG TPA: phosphoglycerate dehydrogenase [Alphaproteobacteria bacterium]|nr:phosphoglycerate dehydrogenase [Alphaproteobacteria bacterium]
MAKPKVLISDKMSERAKEIFIESGVDVDVKTGLKPEELKEIIGNYQGLAIRSSTKVTKDIIDAAKNLKVIARAGIGVDNVDIPAATAKGVIVMNTPFGNSITTAEHTIAMMFAAARQIPAASSSTHASKWEKNKFMGTELAFKTLGMIGCGNIGSIVADRAQGLKMKVMVYDPFLSEERAKDINVEKAATLDDLLKKADFITLHTPLTEQTKNILGAENLKKTKKGVHIVNCARGGLIDEKALKELLDSGHIAGAALDVFETEPAINNVLFGHENVVCTPHLGASTNEAQENVALQVAEQISAYLISGAITNALNVPSVSAEDSQKLNPYISLGEKIGKLAGQVADDGISKVTIEYAGEVSKLNTKPITNVIVKGLLESFVDPELVNIVNAPSIAKDRNIKITESKHEDSLEYNTLVTIKLEVKGKETSVSGSLFNSEPRLVSVDDVKLEAGLEGEMILILNEDKPGLIGGVGNVLGDSKINIANFHLGRSGKNKGKAIALVGVDGTVSKEVLGKIEKLPSVLKVRVLKF